MEYTVAFDAPAEKICQDFTSRDYWQTHIKGLFRRRGGGTSRLRGSVHR